MKWLTDRLGFRGAALLVMGIGQSLQGLSYALTPTKSRDQGFAWIPWNVGPQHAGWTILVCGLTLIVIAVQSKTKPSLQRFGFILAMIPWFALAATFLIAWMQGTHPNGTAPAISYGSWAALAFLMAGWVEPAPTPSEVIDQVRDGRHG